MGIRAKTGFILATLLLGSFVMFAWFSQSVLMQGFLNVEQTSTHKDVTRAADGVKTELKSMSSKASDWAYWDDTYNYATGRMPDFPEINFVPSLADTLVSYWLIYDSTGRQLGSAGYDLATYEPLAIPAGLSKLLAPKSRPLSLAADGNFAELVSLPEGPMLVVARPILRSDKSGPVAGTMVLARPLDDKLISEIGTSTHLTIQVRSAKDSDLMQAAQNYAADAISQSSSPSPVAIPLNADKVAGYLLLKDDFGGPELLLEVTRERLVYREGVRTLFYAGAGISIFMVAVALILDWLLYRFVTAPVLELSSAVGNASRRKTLGLITPVRHRQDEVGRLATAIHQLLEKLEQARRELELAKAKVEQKVVERTRELTRAQTELATAHAQLTASVQSLPFGFALVNERREVLFANEPMALLTGEPVDQFTLPALFRQFDGTLDLADHLHRALASGASTSQDTQLGSRFFTCTVTPVLSGRISQEKHPIGAVILLNDISERRATERARDEFFSIASHELRTPLTAIRGNSELILEHFGDSITDHNHHEMVTDIHAASVRLITIVNDFLDSSRLEMGKMSFKTTNFDLVTLGESIVREFQAASQRGIKIALAAPKTPLMVSADIDRTRQIIVNLVGNAVRYTAVGTITLELSQNQESVTTRVKDTGAGIALDQQHLLFHKFQQAGTSILTRDATNSTGLGLYISRLLAEAMHGTLKLEWSELGKGSSFVLELPAEGVQPATKK